MKKIQFFTLLVQQFFPCRIIRKPVKTEFLERNGQTRNAAQTFFVSAAISFCADKIYSEIQETSRESSYVLLAFDDFWRDKKRSKYRLDCADTN